MRAKRFITTAVASAVIAGGCAYRHGDIVRQGNLRIELSPPTGPQLYGVYVEQSADQLVVSGFGKRPNTEGRVEVQIVRSDGEVLARAEATMLPPLAVPKRSYNYRFRAVLPLIPPDGSVVRVLYHELGRETPPWSSSENADVGFLVRC